MSEILHAFSTEPRSGVRTACGRCRFPGVSLVALIGSVALLAAIETGATAPDRGAVTPPDPAPAPKAEILGLWKGTSTCAKIEEHEFCNDETIVYNFVDIPSQPATVALKAARIVDGTMQRTFDLYFTYRPETRKWTCEFTRPQGRAVWEYVIEGDGLTGSAKLLPDLTVVRNVAAKRTTRDQVPAR
jgi:hypothetical protein